MKLFVLVAFISSFCFAEQRVFSKDRNLLDVKTILEQHDKPNVAEAHIKHFKGETLAYVTPWNNRGNKKRKEKRERGLEIKIY